MSNFYLSKEGDSLDSIVFSKYSSTHGYIELVIDNPQNKHLPESTNFLDFTLRLGTKVYLPEVKPEIKTGNVVGPFD